MNWLVILLPIQGMIFVVWTFLMYRSLFRLRRRAVARSGQIFPGLSATLEAFGAFVTDPEFARDRRQLGWATVVMLASIGAFALTRT
ncbi:MAG: hypothetical protein Q7J57_02485 [Gemmobacter sp.]|nr:hypothetical protein [Gemmobacter sp.]